MPRRTPPPPATRSTGSHADPAHLSDVVRFDLPRLGDIAGLRRRPPAVPHRHRHGLARPARRADDRARLLARRRSRRPARLAEAARAPTSTFVESDVYDAVEALGRERFDLVFTGVGALCWLPDVRRWARVVARPAAPGRPAVHARGPPRAVVAGRRAAGRPARARLPVLRDAPSRSSGTSRAPTSRPTSSSRTTSRTSGTTASARSSPRSSTRGLELTRLEEHDSVPWDALPGQMEDMAAVSGG